MGGIDDSSIENETELWRRIPPHHYPRSLERPSSGAFDDDPDGSPMSVVINQSNRTPEEILEGHDGFGVAKITAKLCRELNLKIIRDPLTNEPDHALVIGNKTDSVRKKLAKGSQLIIEPNRPD